MTRINNLIQKRQFSCKIINKNQQNMHLFLLLYYRIVSSSLRTHAPILFQILSIYSIEKSMWMILRKSVNLIKICSVTIFFS